MIWRSQLFTRLGIFRNSTKKLPETSLRAAVLQKKIRQTINANQLGNLVENEFGEIQSIGKTLLLEFINEFHLEANIKAFKNYQKVLNHLYQLKDLQVYEQSSLLSILNKLKNLIPEGEQRDNFLKFKQTCTENLCSAIKKREEIDISDSLNVLFLYRIYQEQPALYLEVLRLIDAKIYLLGDWGAQYRRGWSITLHQFKQSSWAQLRQFTNILKFLCEDFSVKNFDVDLEYLVKVFDKISTLRLHLVGPKQIPKCILQIIQILQPQVPKLNLNSLNLILTSISMLPAQICPKFQATIVRRIIDQCKRTNSFTNVPLHLLAEQQLAEIFWCDQSQKNFWNFFFYYAEGPQRVLFKSQTIKKIIKKSFKAKLVELRKMQWVKNSFSRIVTISKHLADENEEQLLGELRKESIHLLQNNFFRENCEDFSYANLLNLLCLFEGSEYEKLRRQLSSFIKQVIQRRKLKTKFNRHLFHCNQAINIHVRSNIVEVQDIICFLTQEIIKTHQYFHFDYDGQALFALLPIFNQRHRELINAMIGKLKLGEEEILAQYFLLSFEKNNIQGLKMIELLLQRNFPLEKLIQFISSLGIRYIRDRFHIFSKPLVSYLSTCDINFKISTLNINVINRVLDMFLEHFQFARFCLHLYLHALDGLYAEIRENEEWKPMKKSSRLLVDFLFKFQIIVGSKEQFRLEGKKNILQKVNAILKELMKFDHEVYLKCRYVEFVSLYRQFLKQKEGIQIDKLHKLHKALSLSKNTQNLSEIALILIKLHCLQFISLDSSQYSQYLLTIENSLRSGKITIYNIREQMKLVLHELKLGLLSAAVEDNLRNTLCPIIERGIKMSALEKHTQFMLPFLQFFILLNDQKMIIAIHKQIMKGFVTANQFVDLLYKLPYAMINHQIIKDMTPKLRELIKHLKHYILKIVFFFNRIYVEVPKQIDQLVFNASEQYLANAIKEIQASPNLSINEKKKKLSLYQYHLFACIKKQRMHGKVYNFLMGWIRANPEDFRDLKKKDGMMKFVNKCILNVALVGQTKQNKVQVMDVDQQLIPNPSFKMFMVEKGQAVATNEWVGNIMVPYYLPQKNKILLLENESKGKEGLIRFKMVVYKHLTGCSVETYQSKTFSLLQAI